VTLLLLQIRTQPELAELLTRVISRVSKSLCLLVESHCSRPGASEGMDLYVQVATTSSGVGHGLLSVMHHFQTCNLLSGLP
jgi:hypothetical protein